MPYRDPKAKAEWRRRNRDRCREHKRAWLDRVDPDRATRIALRSEISALKETIERTEARIRECEGELLRLDPTPYCTSCRTRRPRTEFVRDSTTESGLARHCNACKQLRKAARRDFEVVLDRHGGRCFNCGATENLSVDHHYPIWTGVGNDLANLVPLCKACNAAKHDKLPEDFYSPDKMNEYEKLGSLAPKQDAGRRGARKN